MCGIWRQTPNDLQGELSPQDYKRILTDRLFSRISFVSVQGGEPTLRTDLEEIAATIVERLPRLRSLNMVSNGLSTKKVLSDVSKMVEICSAKKISLSISISAHGVGKVVDEAYGVNSASERVASTLKELRLLSEHFPFHLLLNCVLTNVTLHSVHDFLRWSQDEGFPTSFFLGEVRERFMNMDMEEIVRISERDRPFLVSFLRQLSRNRNLLNHSAFRYDRLADMIEGNSVRDLSCHYAMGGVILGSDGSLYYCPHSRAIGNCRTESASNVYYDETNLRYRKNSILRQECLHCPPNEFSRMELEKDILKYIWFLLTPPKNVG
jgi:MoaA/NifB/PqqE/SkfB family radical SAM enzyme